MNTLPVVIMAALTPNSEPNTEKKIHLLQQPTLYAANSPLHDLGKRSRSVNNPLNCLRVTMHEPDFPRTATTRYHQILVIHNIHYVSANLCVQNNIQVLE